MAKKKSKKPHITKENARELGRKGGKAGARNKDVERARRLNQHEVDLSLSKMLYMSQVELRNLINDPQTTALQLLVARILEKGIETGDHTRMSFLLDRTIGKVPVIQEIDLNADIYTQVMNYLDE